MSGMPVTFVDDGGLPVISVDSGGYPVTSVDSGGLAVTESTVAKGGWPVTVSGGPESTPEVELTDDDATTALMDDDGTTYLADAA